MATTYTEPTPQTGYVNAVLLGHRGILDYVVGWGDPAAYTRIGPNFAFFIPDHGTVVDLDCDVIPADQANIYRTATAYDKGSRRCMKPTEYNAFQRFRNARNSVLEVISDDLVVNALTRLDSVLSANTGNTFSLATDNTFTLTEWMRLMARVQKYGVGLSDLAFVTSSELVYASLLAAGAVQVTPQMSDLRNVAAYMNGVPIIIDVNFSNSTSTGGVAGYLIGRGGVVGGFDDLDVTVYDTKDRLTGGYDITATWAYGFALTESDTSDKRVVKVINP